MSNQVHARFQLNEDTRVRCSVYKDQKYTTENGLRVKMSPVHGEPFGTATPGGELTMVIANSEAIKFFKEAEIGQEYDVVFTPVQK